MSILRPHEDRFYLLFEDAAANVRNGAEMLLAMLEDYTAIDVKAKAIKDIEHKGDDMTHTVYDQLNRIFVTPIDREDVAAIASALDDIIDLIEVAADDFIVYNIELPTPSSIDLTRNLVHAVAQVQEAIALLRNRRERAALREHLTEINRLENEGDALYRTAMQALFRQPDPVQMIKWKQIYDHIEEAIDKCEDVADVLHGVLLKYA